MAQAQVLYNETFDNLTLGDIGADLKGQTQGQGGWYTTSVFNFLSTSYFQIESKGNGDKNILLKSGPEGSYGNNILEKKGLDVVWNSRTTGNDVLKLEFEMYVGYLTVNDSDPNAISAFRLGIQANGVHPEIGIVGITFDPYQQYLSTGAYDGKCCLAGPPALANLYSLVKNKWFKVEIYVDYKNGIAVFDYPSLGIRKQTNLLINLPQPKNYYNYYPTGIVIFSNTSSSARPIGNHKFDNFKITAIDKIPTLSVNDWLSNSFSLYPNPATNVVNITNTENLEVQQVTVYDVTGKQVLSQNTVNQTNIALNIESLASGTYMLHLQTKQGLAVKKLVKK